MSGPLACTLATIQAALSNPDSVEESIYQNSPPADMKLESIFSPSVESKLGSRNLETYTNIGDTYVNLEEESAARLPLMGQDFQADCLSGAPTENFQEMQILAVENPDYFKAPDIDQSRPLIEEAPRDLSKGAASEYGELFAGYRCSTANSGDFLEASKQEEDNEVHTDAEKFDEAPKSGAEENVEYINLESKNASKDVPAPDVPDIGETSI